MGTTRSLQGGEIAFNFDPTRGIPYLIDIILEIRNKGASFALKHDPAKRVNSRIKSIRRFDPGWGQS